MFVFAFAPDAFTKTDQETEQAIEAVLAERHPTDTAQWWRELGTNTPKIILKMIENTQETYRRLRLVEALAWFEEDSQAVEFLKQEADRTQEDVIRNASIKSVGLSQGVKELEFISKFLKHPDPQTRFAAAGALQGMKDPKAQARLEHYLKEEKATWITERLKGRLAQPLRPLTIVSSSEDKVSSEFEGMWRGYALFPKRGRSGMNSWPVLVHFKAGGATQLQGDVVTTLKKGQTKVFQFRELKAQGQKLRAVLPPILKDLAKSPQKSSKAGGGGWGVEGELREQAGFLLLELRVASQGGILFLRKE